MNHSYEDEVLELPYIFGIHLHKGWEKIKVDLSGRSKPLVSDIIAGFLQWFRVFEALEGLTNRLTRGYLC